MNLSFTPEEEAFRTEVREFLKNKLPARLADKVRTQKHLTRDDMTQWHAVLNERGWLAPPLAAAWGGPGWSAVQSSSSSTNARSRMRRESCRSASTCSGRY